jgi:hypothetical protein
VSLLGGLLAIIALAIQFVAFRVRSSIAAQH